METMIDLNRSFSNTQQHEEDLNHHAAIKEAATDGLRSFDRLIAAISGDSAAGDFIEAADFAVSRFKRVISVLNRTGHARFRRAPQSAAKSDSPQSPAKSDPDLPPPMPAKKSESAATTTTTSQQSSSTASFLSSVTTTNGGGEGSVSNGVKSAAIAPPAKIPASGKPPLGNPRKRLCHETVNSATTSSSCHCHKKRKNRFVKKIRVPAISSKIADIPQDEFSWRKYGQKPIKGSPFPRGYYKCSSVKGCPAKKHVERARDDPAMLIISYKWEHSHPSIPQSLTVTAPSS